MDLNVGDMVLSDHAIHWPTDVSGKEGFAGRFSYINHAPHWSGPAFTGRHTVECIMVERPQRERQTP